MRPGDGPQRCTRCGLCRSHGSEFQHVARHVRDPKQRHPSGVGQAHGHAPCGQVRTGHERPQWRSPIGPQARHEGGARSWQPRPHGDVHQGGSGLGRSGSQRRGTTQVQDGPRRPRVARRHLRKRRKRRGTRHCRSRAARRSSERRREEDDAPPFRPEYPHRRAAGQAAQDRR